MLPCTRRHFILPTICEDAMKHMTKLLWPGALILFSAALLAARPAVAQETLEEIIPAIRSGRLNDAAKKLERFIERNPENFDAYLLLGRVHIAIGGPNSHTAAEKALLKAHALSPENADACELMARLRDRQEMEDDAARWRERANTLRAASKKKDFHLLIDFYIKSGYAERLRELLPELRQALESDPENPECYLCLGRALTYLAVADTAVQVLEKGAALAPTHPAIKYALARAYLLTNKGDKFTETYMEWLKSEHDGQILEREFAIAALSMPETETHEFNRLPFDEKSACLVKYWGLHDPYPVSVQNERLLEHVWRTMYAEKAFPTNRGILGFDERGEVYIRWGEPEGRYADPMPGMAGPYSVRPNESWSYPSYDMNLNFDFVDTGGYYEEVQSLATAIIGGSHLSSTQDMEENGTLFALKSLYAQRGHLGGKYHFLATEPDAKIFNMDVRAAPLETGSTKRGTEPRFEFSLSLQKLNFIQRHTQFRGEGGKTRLDLAYAVPMDDLLEEKTRAAAAQFRFNTDFVLIDSAGVRNLHTGGEQTFDIPSGAEKLMIYYLKEDRHEAHPGKYDFSFQILEALTNRGDYVIEPITLRDFTGSVLMISDIKYSPQLKITGEPEAGVPSVSMLPHPFLQVDSKKPVYLYFEVYNLMQSPDGAKFRVSLNVARVRSAGEYAALPVRLLGRLFSEGKPREIESTYERMVEGGDSVEYLELDLSAIEPGKTRFTVTIEDLNSGGRTSADVVLTLE